MAQIFSSFDQLKAMYDKELYSNVVVMASLMLTSCEQNFETLNSSSKYLTMVYYGHSAFKLAQYKKAESIYRQALHYKKTIIKIKNIKPSENLSKDLMPDIDVKFNLHICHLKLGHSELAIETIQSIPGRHRNAKINMTLAKLCQKYSMERTAISAYKEVLKECPLAIEAAEGLLSLGVSGAEVASLVIETNVSGFEWYAAWIKAKAFFYARSYKDAITAFKTLDESDGLRGNHSLLVNIGEAYHHIGDNRNAISILQRARAGEPAMQRGLDILAFLLMHEKKLNDLERIISPWIGYSENSAEVCVAIGYHLFANGHLTRALYLAQRACIINSRYVEGYLLKGLLLFDLKKYTESVTHFREAYQIAPYRYEPHKGIVICYLAMHRYRESGTVALNAYNQLGNSPRVLTLYATALMKDPSTAMKSKVFLEKALSIDENFLPAVIILAEIYEEEMNFDAAIKLLEKQIELCPTTELHQLLGDLFIRTNDEPRAFEQYHLSLVLDPSNRRSIEGMQRIHSSTLLTGSNTSRNDPTSYYNMSDNDNNPSESSFEIQAQDMLQDSDHEAGSDISVD